MTDEAKDARRVVTQTMFIVQICLIGTILLLLLVGYALEKWWGATYFGFFWFAFLAGCIGASIGVLKRITKNDPFVTELAQSRIATLMPLLYGGLMAGVTYLLFMSGLLSGDGGNGLLTTNLFPNFESAANVEASFVSYLEVRPESMADVGKLMVWSFLAGYSERFVADILGQLEGKTTPGA
jgi:hypothetical protein